MPYCWNTSEIEAPYLDAPLPVGPDTAPAATLRLWPHRSLPAKGFVWTFALMFTLALLPLMAFVGTVALWVLLPFMLGAIGALWLAIRVSDRDGLSEEVTFWTDQVQVTRCDPKSPPRTWQENPYWITLDLRAKGGPVEDYLTLTGSGRQIELGAFLSADERRQLRDDLAFVLGQLKNSD